MPKVKEVVRKEARISVNRLGEYLSSTPNHQNTILKKQKRPGTGGAPQYYYEAEKPIVKYLTGEISFDKLIQTAINLIEEIPASKWYEHRNPHCADAIMRFAKFTDIDKLMAYERQVGSNTNGKMLIEGVQLSVRPEIILKGKSRGKEVYGAIKLNISNSFSLDRPVGDHSAGEYIAAAVNMYMNQYLIENELDGKIAPGMCIVVDVFDRRLYSSPVRIGSLRKEITAACRNINRLWSFL
jgi:hypothetical protein